MIVDELTCANDSCEVVERQLVYDDGKVDDSVETLSPRNCFHKGAFKET